MFSQLCRYGVVGAVSNLLAYFAYLLLTWLGMPPKSAMSIVYLMAATLAFSGHRILTFSHKGKVGAAVGRYVLAHCFGYLLNLLLLAVFVDYLGFRHELVQAIAILVVAGFLFLTFRYAVFSSARLGSSGVRGEGKQ